MIFFPINCVHVHVFDKVLSAICMRKKHSVSLSAESPSSELNISLVLSQPNISFSSLVVLSLNLTTTAVPLILTSSTSDISLNMTPTSEPIQPSSNHSLTNIAVLIVAVVSLALLATGIVLVPVIVVLVLR